MYFLLILGIMLVGVYVCLGLALIQESDEKVPTIMSCFGFIIGFFAIFIYINSKPRAIDVYRNKTELRITYEGNIPVDSVVVFKK